MISLKKTIEAYDYRTICQAALETYTAAIESLAKNAIGIDPESLTEYRNELAGLKQRMEAMELNLADVTPAELKQVSSDLDGHLKRHRGEVESSWKQTTSDLRDLVTVLAEAADSLSQRENLHGGQLSRISGGLEAISQINDLAQVRATLNRQVFELRTCISSMARDNESALSSLQREITGFQQRLEKVQVEASTDPLTGLANRLRCTREVGARIRSQNPFGILLFDLNKFKNVNDSLGHAAGDSVLRAMAHRLVSRVRSRDMVCRWGGDEFVVLHDGLAGELSARAEEIAKEISGPLTIRLNEGDHELSVGAAFGWADYRSGETAEQLFARADKLLYDAKSPRPQLLPTEESTDGLAPLEDLKAAIAGLEGDLSGWFLGCLAIRFAARVNSHYGFPATEALLPFLRDAIPASKFGAKLFRGRGASILILMKSPAGREALEAELRRICATGLEKNLKLKRRASVLPVPVVAKTLPVASQDLFPELDRFIDLHSTAETSAKFLKKVVV